MKMNYAKTVSTFRSSLCSNGERQPNTTGRPRKNIKREEVESFCDLHRSWKVVATLKAVSERTLARRRNASKKFLISAKNLQYQTCDYLEKVLQQSRKFLYSFNFDAYVCIF